MVNNFKIDVCWFHFDQTSVRKFMLFNLWRLYKTSSSFRLYIKMTAVLSFVPKENVHREWGGLSAGSEKTTKILIIRFLFFTWFAENYKLGNQNDNHSITFWSFNDRIKWKHLCYQ